jgi:hypothetical protein
MVNPAAAARVSRGDRGLLAVLQDSMVNRATGFAIAVAPGRTVSR